MRLSRAFCSKKRADWIVLRGANSADRTDEVQISFLLGPAGTGKTFRCLKEIRDELRSRPEGPPLVFLAPKQSTYQLERQLLEDAELSGYSRLQILSFERLARFIFSEFRQPLPQFLSEQVRVMVLRALLSEWADQLTIFRNAARRAGFAEELSKQIREFQNHGFSPAGIRKLAAQLDRGRRAPEKLSDLALIYAKYQGWLKAQSLEDGDALLTGAADLLTAEAPLRLGGVWFDGFAQLTPQELRLLTGLLRFTPHATLAFCADGNEAPRTSASPWFLVSQTLSRCRAALEQSYGRGVMQTQLLPRESTKSRFAKSAALAHLERFWSAPEPRDESADEIQMVQAANAEGEAVFAAREIVKLVRSGARYRDAALLLRSFEGDYLHVLQRVFRRYEIPAFLDHRESVAHHALAELTRGALRTLAYGWKHQDWFATLKCGLFRARPEELDVLENEALARGWDASAWRNGFSIPGDGHLETALNRARLRLIEPLLALEKKLGGRPAAGALAEAVRGLWRELSVEDQLKDWSQKEVAAAMHGTVWEQMNQWLEDLALAFRGQQHPFGVWLPILEAGLMNLTVGVVPPVLDQVLIGSVDRSRNPDLKVLFVLGMNERVFPAPPARDSLLAEDDRAALMDAGCTLGEWPALRLAAEQFYGYIACTRPRERLVITFSRMALDGTQLNPSRFVGQIARLFPSLQVQTFDMPSTAADVVHSCEFAALGIPQPDGGKALQIAAPNQREQLDPGLAARLYGKEVELSVSALERFASCPFQFFMTHGLNLRERDEFQLDVRQQGSFQHEVLAAFHEELVAEGLQWRDVTRQEARARIGRIAERLTGTFKDGLLTATEQNRFTAEVYKKSLQEFIGVVIDWFKTNRFDPERVEFGFGKESSLPGWRVPLKNGSALVIHGRIDRVDLYRDGEREAKCVIMDYKSGQQRPDKVLLYHGVQQQMPIYLLAMTKVPQIAAHFGVERLTPAGCFLLPLRGSPGRSKTGREALANEETARREAYTHGGVYNVDFLGSLDSSAPEESSGQFEFRFTKERVPYKNSFNALRPDEFSALLNRSEELLRQFGERIYEGEIAIFPYKRNRQTTACKRCKMQSICRFDPAAQKFNVLRMPAPANADAAGHR